jgi:hypothetical protein
MSIEDHTGSYSIVTLLACSFAEVVKRQDPLAANTLLVLLRLSGTVSTLRLHDVGGVLA